MEPRAYGSRRAIVAQIIDIEIDDQKGWHEEAACRESDTDLFFDFNTWDEAIAICQECPVRLECLADTLVEAKQFGIFGGERPDDRYRIRRALMEERRNRERATEASQAQ